MLVRKLLPKGNGPKARVNLWAEPEEIVDGVITAVGTDNGTPKTNWNR
jgi:hypothetical protein